MSVNTGKGRGGRQREKALERNGAAFVMFQKAHHHNRQNAYYCLRKLSKVTNFNYEELFNFGKVHSNSLQGIKEGSLRYFCT